MAANLNAERIFAANFSNGKTSADGISRDEIGCNQQLLGRKLNTMEIPCGKILEAKFNAVKLLPAKYYCAENP